MLLQGIGWLSSASKDMTDVDEVDKISARPCGKPNHSDIENK